MRKQVLLNALMGSLAFWAVGFMSVQPIRAAEDKSTELPAPSGSALQVQLEISPARVLSSYEDWPEAGVHSFPWVYPYSRGRLFLTWNFDRDLCDGAQPDYPIGLVSDDGGETWRRNTTMFPMGGPWKAGYVMHPYCIGGDEMVSFWEAFRVPDTKWTYKVPFWRSRDGGRSWSDTQWTEVEFPGVKGVNIYEPSDAYKKTGNWRHGFVPPQPPAYVLPFIEQCSPYRNSGLFPQVTDADGVIYSFANVVLNEDYFYPAVVLHTSADRGKSWRWMGVVAYDQEHSIPIGKSYEPSDVDCEHENCFTEPSVVMYPDGEMVCVMRTGSFKPLYITRSVDRGKTWEKPSRLNIRGVLPQLLLMSNGLVALATGRPGCTLHFSNDRGRSWGGHISFFEQCDSKDPKCKHHSGYPLHEDPNVPSRGMTSGNVASLVEVAPGKLLYVHDIERPLPEADDPWIRAFGNGMVVARFITVKSP